jgi:hypothetical protein
MLRLYKTDAPPCVPTPAYTTQGRGGAEHHPRFPFSPRGKGVGIGGLSGETCYVSTRRTHRRASLHLHIPHKGKGGAEHHPRFPFSPRGKGVGIGSCPVRHATSLQDGRTAVRPYTRIYHTRARGSKLGFDTLPVPPISCTLSMFLLL